MKTCSCILHSKATSFLGALRYGQCLILHDQPSLRPAQCCGEAGAGSAAGRCGRRIPPRPSSGGPSSGTSTLRWRRSRRSPGGSTGASTAASTRAATGRSNTQLGPSSSVPKTGCRPSQRGPHPGEGDGVRPAGSFFHPAAFFQPRTPCHPD